MSEVKLKPCPFCGGRGRLRKINSHTYRVVCSQCGASSPPTYVKEWHRSKFIAQGQAGKAWNTRYGEIVGEQARAIREKEG